MRQLHVAGGDALAHGLRRGDELDHAVGGDAHLHVLFQRVAAGPFQEGGDAQAAPQALGRRSLGALLKAAGQIPVYRGTADAANSLRGAYVVVQNGGTAVIYPEQTLTYDPNLWPMTGATGAARLALESRIPVIPVAQWGAQNVIPRWRKGLKLIPPQTMYVTAGPAVDFSDLYDRASELSSFIEATNRIMQAITAQLEQIRGEAAPAERWDRRNQREERKGH